MTPEREADIRTRALLAAACAVEAVGGPLDTIERDRADLLAELDLLRAAHERLRGVCRAILPRIGEDEAGTLGSALGDG